MYLIVGLGNPGKKYTGTRHNVGYMVLDLLSRKWGIEIDKQRFDGLVGIGRTGSEQVLLLKPETFMNRSGQAVRAAMDFYKLEPKDLVVIYDDMALPVGQLRIRQQGSAGGHNGLTDVLSHAGTEQVGRIRVGIGNPPPMIDAVDHVLGQFRTDERANVDEAIRFAADAVDVILSEGWPKAMERFNRSKKDSADSQEK
jgi:PTH1 family peptidyl-tRNA hydrolase